jgi:hypothetical protein
VSYLTQRSTVTIISSDKGFAPPRCATGWLASQYPEASAGALVRSGCLRSGDILKEKRGSSEELGARLPA